VIEDIESMSLTEGVEDDVRLATADIPTDGMLDVNEDTGEVED